MSVTSRQDCELRRLLLSHFAELNANLARDNAAFVQSPGVQAIAEDTPAGRLLQEFNAIVNAQSLVLTELLSSRIDEVNQESLYWLSSN